MKPLYRYNWTSQKFEIDVWWKWLGIVTYGKSFSDNYPDSF